MLSVKNWAGNVQFNPASITRPKTEAEVSALIEEALRQSDPVRVIGSGHSFTPLMETQGVLVSLDEMSGLIQSNPETGLVSVWAGTKLKDLGHALHEQGLALENLGDIDVQSLAGAFSTGTHGTGLQLGCLATQIQEITFINGLGKKIRCSEAELPEVFKAAQVSLGLLGIITQVQIKTIPRYKLEMQSQKQTLSEVLSQISSANQKLRHFEFFWFPHTETVIAKRTQVSEQAVLKRPLRQKFNDVILENSAFQGISSLTRTIPVLAPSMSRLCAATVSESLRRDWSHLVFATPRLVKFHEMEYGIPIENFDQAIAEIRHALEVHRYRVHFPIECRFVKGDDIPLSPAYGRDSAFIAVHVYKGMPYREYFDAVEAICRKYQGRPHWGKMHTLEAIDFKSIYPQWNQFQKVRKEMDPHGVFLSPYLQKLFRETS